MRLRPFIDGINEEVRGGVRTLDHRTNAPQVVPSSVTMITSRSSQGHTLKVFVCGIDSCGDPDTIVGGKREVS